MKRYLLLGLLLSFIFTVGCEQSYIRFSSEDLIVMDTNDANAPWGLGYIEAKGEAATTLAKQYADNIKTKEGLIADVFKRNGELFAGLIITLVGGMIFWGFTRSRFGWVIPSACIAGIAAILFFVNFTKWIALGVLVVVIGLLVWKVIEYHKERDALLSKEKTNG